MIHPHTELKFISPAKGFGVVATKLIPKGTITWVLDPLDQVFGPQSIRELKPVFREILFTYSYRDKNGDFVLCWDHSRFINHSFHSNCLSTAYNLELAIRDIFPGEELTDDYGYLNLTEPFNCLREEGTLREQALPDDLLNFYPDWDSQLMEAFKYFNLVNQPLQAMIEQESRLKVQQVADDPSQMDSILSCYYPDPTYSTGGDYAR